VVAEQVQPRCGAVWDQFLSTLRTLSMSSLIGRKILIALFALALGTLLLWLAARSVDLHEAKNIVKSSDWRWIGTGIALFGGDLLMRTARWRVILSHRAAIEYSRVARGLIVGYAVNILLPGRLGELFRVDYLARLTGVGRPIILASIFLERLLDLFIVVALFAVGLALAGVHNPAISKVIASGIIALAIGVVALYLIVRLAAHENMKFSVFQLASRLVSERITNRVLVMFGDFASLIEIVRTRRFLAAIALSIPIWFAEILSMYSICRAVDLALPPTALMVLLGAASLSTLFPTAPGFVGSYQFAFVIVLGNFGVSDTLAVVAATGVQVYLMAFYAVVGMFVWVFESATGTAVLPRDYSG
jgi:uncharacterized protein (TIRG00374 family)